MRFAKLAGGEHDGPGDGPDIARVLHDVDRGESFEQPVEHPRGREFEKRLAVTGASLCMDDVVALLDERDHLFDQFRRVLQVGVENHHDVAVGKIDASRHGHLMAAVPSETHRPHLGVGCSQVVEEQPRVVTTAVVDEQHVHRHAAPLEGFCERSRPAEKVRYHILLVVPGHDERDAGYCSALLH